MPQITPKYLAGDWRWFVGKLPGGVYVVSGSGHSSVFFDSLPDALQHADGALLHLIRYSKRNSPSRQRWRDLWASLYQCAEANHD